MTREQARRAQRRAEGRECVMHSWQTHGKEAEELRSGIDILIRRTDQYPEELSGDEARDQLECLRRGLVKLLDDVDARDSLAYLERNPKRRKATLKRSNG